MQRLRGCIFKSWIFKVGAVGTNRRHAPLRCVRARFVPARFFRCQVWLLACIVTAGIAWAQTAQTGALTGSVTDPGGRVVHGVIITVTSSATGHTQTAVTQSDGKYIVPLLPPDTYKVTVAEKNFKTIEFDRVRINVTETSTLNVRLEIGSVTEVLSVQADAVPLDTTSSSLGHVSD